MEEIDVSKLEANFKFEIAGEPGGENVMACFACGTCTAGCPVREINSDYNPRRIIRMVLLGMKDRVLSSDFVWLCSACYTCDERCPQDVKIPEVMRVLRNLAVREGNIHPSYAQQVKLIGSQGRLYEIDEFDNRTRQRLGLPAIHTERDEVEEIFRITGVDKTTRV